MYSILLALSFLGLEPNLPESQFFLEKQGAKWIVFYSSSFRTFSGKYPVYRVLMTKSQYCSHVERIEAGRQVLCDQEWQQEISSDMWRDGEVEIEDENGYHSRHREEDFCAFNFRNRFYSQEMCSTLWKVFLGQQRIRAYAPQPSLK